VSGLKTQALRRADAPKQPICTKKYAEVGLTVQTLIAEVGSDMNRFATEAHFVSFLGLSPSNKISGGKVVGREKRRTKNRAGTALRLAAGTLLESGTCGFRGMAISVPN
jgi:transposase